MNVKIKDVVELEEKLITHTYGDKTFELLKGNSKIIVSAPHSIEQLRNGKIKAAETRTASIAYYLHELTDCHAIFKTNFNPEDPDPNYDDHSEYRDAIVKFVNENNVKLLIDLHICSPDREFDLDLGTANEENTSHLLFIEETFKEAFHKHHFDNVGVDQRFRAKNIHCVSPYIHSHCGIPAIQVEINWHDIAFDGDANSYYRILDSFAKTVKELEKKL